ncbi:MAG: DUF1800 domain-containing protein [Planctomycetes bacterium]|nr:DUF1800 domain-containing protein [Planctomycetota bacterium]
MTPRPSTRRSVLRAGASLAAVSAFAALPGCDRMVGIVPGVDDGLPDRVDLPGIAGVESAFHLLSRAAYGARPGDVDRVRRMGRAAWIDEQLHPETIDDRACDWRVADCESMEDEPLDLRSVEPEVVDRDLTRHHLIRAVHSKRRIHEVMVGFWCDHFSMQTAKKGCREAKPWDDREVVRAHALGRFRDLVGASARSPAMLRYLDNAENRRERPADRPNENYARELLELHTLGVHGGYTQNDVMEAARCLTGFTVEDRAGLEHVFDRGRFAFRKDWHDDGAKVVLGTTVPASGGEADLDRLLDIVCGAPATARHLATKLCRRFVADPPPATVVESTAKVFTDTGGDLRAVVRHILTSDEFETCVGCKTKRPFEFIVSSIRAVGGVCRAGPEELRYLERLGHVPFHYPTPDGYPEEPEPWMGTLLWRWNFAVALTTNRLGETQVDLLDLAKRAGLDAKAASPADLAPFCFGRPATAEERAAIDAYAARAEGSAADRRAEGVALLLCAPAFQVA